LEFIEERTGKNKTMTTKKDTAKKVAPTAPVMWIPPERKRSSGSKKIRVMRNPWVPDDIIILLKFLCTYKAGKYLFELVKLWMEHRNAQRIEIKVGDAELNIEGHVSDKALEKKITRFRELIAGATYEDIKVAIPKGAKRTIPAKLADRKAKRGNDK
jgi:hypothetical protein